MTKKAWTTTELYTTAGNEPGMLAKCAHYFREEGIDITAFSAYEIEAGTSAFRFVCSDNAKAKACLIKNGYKVDECEVVCWDASNTTGTLYHGTAAIAEKRINVNYSYATCQPDTKTCWVVFNTDNNMETTNTLCNC